MEEQKDNFWGLPIGKETTLDALVKDVWNPDTEEIFPPKNFIGVGWGVNLHAIAKKLGVF
ncbi:MAG: DUF5808 domain-containing protein [Leptospiraceae bacterium]|nr:DUF5808 domain-containing protein [Leptospiraceae bacterium]